MERNAPIVDIAPGVKKVRDPGPGQHSICFHLPQIHHQQQEKKPGGNKRRFAQFIVQ
jgi:hypothetical protein